jgi:voltage-gated potassium channel
MEESRSRSDQPPRSLWRERLFTIIFEADTPAGRLFDILLIGAILVSVVAVMLESVSSIRIEHGTLLRGIEWVLTILFTIEYGFRLISARNAVRYARSFYGLVDLLAILPTWISIFLAGAQTLAVIRALRLLRIFRILKLSQFLGEAEVLMTALRNSRRKIVVFVGGVLTLILILGTAMYMIEGEANGFTSIPRSIYWAIVTMTTVGYGDIAPQTVVGQFLASIMMIIGYAIIAVPTGIVSVELARSSQVSIEPVSCPACSRTGHGPGDAYCRFCGSELKPDRIPRHVSGSGGPTRPGP